MDIDHIASESGTAPTIEEKNKKVTLRAEDLAFGFSNEKSVKGSSNSLIEKIKKTWAEASFFGPLTQLKLDEASSIDGRLVQVNSKQLIHFGSCAYLGQEFNENLISAGIMTMRKYGTQFSSSSTYIALHEYEVLREELHKIFNCDVVIAATTTLAHFSVIPAIIKESDSIILDQLVHNSVQLATKTVSNIAKIIKTIPHNNLASLEEQIIKLRVHSKRIWYFLDGVYSMHGDVAPLAEIEELLRKYPELHIYVDDAHGMSWFGANGCGYAWANLNFKARVIVSVSLSKSFSGGGAAIVSTSVDLLSDIRNFGPTMIFSGPLHPVLLGITVESARLHLSDTVKVAQNELRKRIEFRNLLLEECEIPVEIKSHSPISFITIGNHIKTGEVFNTLKNRGLYVNPAMFPAISNSKSGIRFTITTHLRFDDIERLVRELRELINH